MRRRPKRSSESIGNEMVFFGYLPAGRVGEYPKINKSLKKEIQCDG